MPNIPITNLNSGEMTPKISERIDIEKYVSGCRHLENMIPMIYGGVERRPGTIFLISAIIKGDYGFGNYGEGNYGE